MCTQATRAGVGTRACLFGYHRTPAIGWLPALDTGSGLGTIAPGKVERGSMTGGATCSINDLLDVYTALKTCKHTLMASCKSRQ